eukprot:6435_1
MHQQHHQVQINLQILKQTARCTVIVHILCNQFVNDQILPKDNNNNNGKEEMDIDNNNNNNNDEQQHDIIMEEKEEKDEKEEKEEKEEKSNNSNSNNNNILSTNQIKKLINIIVSC